MAYKNEMVTRCLLLGAMLLASPFMSATDNGQRTTDSGQKTVDNGQRATVSGSVVDENGEPLIGVSVQVTEHKTVGTSTDAKGHFTLKEIPAGSKTLTFSYIGMKTQVIKITKSNIKVVMREDAQSIKEYVVTGYQQIDRRNLTSSTYSVQMEDINVPGVANVDQMLEGKIPDLVLTTNSGEINATAKIRIRGTSTLVGNREPLWVVDGVIITDPVELSSDVLNDPDYVNRIGNAIAGINPQDIKRIDVLKDAAATALYGTRAANGVIVVTTKSGREGKPMVSYTGQFTVRKRPYYTDRSINLMNSAERIKFSQDLVDQHYIYPSGMPKVGYENALSDLYSGTITQSQFEQEVADMQTMNTDWFNTLCHNSFSHDHSVSVTGGSDKVRYYTSIGYTDQDDVINNTTNRRYTAMAKINMDITKRFKAEVNINGYLNKKQYAQDEINPINYAYNTSRAIPAYNADGSYYFYQKAYSGNNIGTGYLGYNVLNELENSYMKQNTNSVTATANLTYNFNDNLFINGVFSTNIQNAQIEGWWGEKTFHSSELRGCEYGDEIPTTSSMPYGGEYSSQSAKNVGWTARVQGNYNKYFGSSNQHNFNVALGFEASSAHYTGDSYSQRGYYEDRGRTFATNIPLTYTSYWSWMQTNVPTITDTKSNLLSAYATVSYSFKQLFTLNANGRYDGSNKFGSRSNEKLLPIWSVSANANLIDIFGIKAPWLNTMTMKASYGEQGNMLEDQTSELVIKKGSMDAYYNEMTSSAYAFANPDLQWEKTHSTNVGLELSFFDNRLQLEAEYYHKYTTDAFLSKTISDINGFDTYVVNSGTITNQGFNFTLTSTPVKLRNFYWILSANLSKIYNKVETAPGAETYELSDFLNGTAVVEGQPIGTFYSYNFAGLNPVDGGPLFYDYEDRQVELSNASNYDTYTKVLVPSGKREPDITGSFSNTFTYKQWRLSSTFTYSLGAKTRLFRLFDGVNSSAYSSEANVNRDLMNRWQQPGDENTTNIPSIMGSGNPSYSNYAYHWSSMSNWTGASIADNAWTMYDYSTARVVSANYMKLSTLSLTYEFDRKVLEKLRLERLALTLSGYNLYTWSAKELRGQTPTQGGFSEVQLSDTPSWTFGLTVNF